MYWDRFVFLILMFEGSSMGILSNNMRFPSPECYTTFWMMTIYSDTLHWSGITPHFDPNTNLDLITEFDFLPNCEKFPYNICNGCGMPKEDAYSSGHLVLSHFGTCRCSYVGPVSPELVLFRTFEFRTFLGTSVLLNSSYIFFFSIKSVAFPIDIVTCN